MVYPCSSSDAGENFQIQRKKNPVRSKSPIEDSILDVEAMGERTMEPYEDICLQSKLLL